MDPLTVALIACQYPLVSSLDQTLPLGLGLVMRDYSVDESDSTGRRVLSTA